MLTLTNILRVLIEWVDIEREDNRIFGLKLTRFGFVFLFVVSVVAVVYGFMLAMWVLAPQFA